MRVMRHGASAVALLLVPCTRDAPPVTSADAAVNKNASPVAEGEGSADSPADAAREWMRLGLELACDEGLTPLTTSRLAGYLGLGLHEGTLTSDEADRSLAPAIEDLGELDGRPAEVSVRVSTAVAAAAVLEDQIASDAARVVSPSTWSPRRRR